MGDPYSLCTECVARNEGRKVGTCFQGADCIDVRAAYRDGIARGRCFSDAKARNAHAAGRAEMAGEVRAMVEGWIRHHDKNAALARDVREPRHEDAHRACAHAMRTLLAQLEEQKP